MSDFVTRERVEWACSAAKKELEKKGVQTAEIANKGPTTLCALLHLKYEDGTKPSRAKHKITALVEWYLSGKTVVSKPYWVKLEQKNRQKADKSASDVRLLRSASAAAAKLVRKTNKAAFDKANASAFLQSRDWKSVRLLALQKYGNKCMACGNTPEFGAVLHVDHIKPRKLYPSLALDIKNLQILCQDCNQGKANWSFQDFRPKPVELKPDPVDLEAKLERLHQSQKG